MAEAVKLDGMSPTPRPSTEAEAIMWLVDRVPELRPILEDHVAYNDALLSYVVFEGDFLPWLVDRVRAEDIGPAARFVAAIEPLLTTDEQPPANDVVWNMAAVSFIEGIVMDGSRDDVIERTRPWMGTNTAKQIDRELRCRSGELPGTA